MEPNKKKRVMCTIAIICAFCSACILSIFVYKSISLRNRYQYCIEIAPDLKAFAVENSVACWKNEMDKSEYFYFPTGSYRIDYSDDRMVVVYDSGADCFYQYEEGVLRLISVGYNDGKYHTYNTYYIEGR